MGIGRKEFSLESAKEVSTMYYVYLSVLMVWTVDCGRYFGVSEEGIRVGLMSEESAYVERQEW